METRTHQMPCSINCRKRKIPKTFRLSCRLSSYHPFSHPRLLISRLPRPLHVKRPPYVSHPVRYKVVCTSVNKNFDASVQQFRDIRLSGVQWITGCPECCIQICIQLLKFSRGVVNSKCCSVLGVIEVCRDEPRPWFWLHMNFPRVSGRLAYSR